MVFYGPRQQVVPFFDRLGFEIPERKGVADFIQEICSEKDQEVIFHAPVSANTVQVNSRITLAS